MSFNGRSYRSLDPKGRLMLPPEVRDALLAVSPEGRVSLTTFDGCLVAYTPEDWEKFEAGFARIKNPSRKMRDFRRLVIGGVEELCVDKQGRVKLSRAHMEYAGITKKVVIVGQGSRFEIWSEEELEAVIGQDFGDVTDELAESGVDFPI